MTAPPAPSADAVVLPDGAPQLSILIPTFGRAEFVRALIARLALQIAAARAGSVEVVVTDNRSFDHTAEVLRPLSALHPWLRVVRPPEHLLSAEENVHFGLQYCRGDYVWGFGDDDEATDAALARIQQILTEDDPDFVLFNVATMSEQGTPTRSRLLSMNAARLSWPIERIIAGVGFMALSACLTAVVARRSMLLAADWSGHLARSPIYAHVVAYLEAFKGARCLLLDEAPMIARQGATGIAEFARIADSQARYVYWPWTVGLPRHLAWLVETGATGPDFPARIVEPQGERRNRLLPYLLSGVARQLEVWAEGGRPVHALAEADLHRFATVAAAAPLAERETLRELTGVAQAIASLNGREGALAAGPALSLLPGADRELVAAALSGPSGDGATHRAPSGGPAAELLAALRYNGRNAAPGGEASAGRSLRALLDALAPAHVVAVEAALRGVLAQRLRSLSAGLTLDALASGDDPTLDEDGLRRVALGGVYVALPISRPLTVAEREDLASVDPQGEGAIVVAPSREALDALIADQPSGALLAPVFDETFLGWRLGVWRGRQAAVPEDEPDLAFALTVASDRKGLRRRVLKARREAEPALASPITAKRRARPVLDGDREAVRGLFEEGWYLAAYPGARRAVEHGVFADALEHWLALGGRFGLNPSAWFDSDDYLADNPQVAAELRDGAYPTALHHYLAEGAAQGARPFSLFDPAFYLEAHSDARAAFARGVSPLAHFLDIGLREGRSITSRFDADAYLKLNPDVGEAVRSGEMSSALLHYVLHGRAEGRAVGRQRSSN